MQERSQYPKITPDQVQSVMFRTVTPGQAQAIKERIRNISRGGILLQTSSPLSIDTIAEITYRPELGGRTIEAVGIVRWVDPDLPGGGIQFIRVTSPEGTSRPNAKTSGRQRAAAPAGVNAPVTGTPASTTVFTDGPTLVATGEFGPAAYNSFVGTWAETLKSDSDRLIIDLTRVSRIASMGVGLLVGAHMDAIKLGKSVTIKAPIIFQRIFAVAGVDRVLRFVYLDSPEDEVLEAGSDITIDDPQEIPMVEEETGESASDFFDIPDPVKAAEEELQRELAEHKKKSSTAGL
ncbi:MAG: PilZ domain-containing protein [Planctomycetota bacterium]|jgi:anti-anti-sigma regulatory factor